MFAWFNRWKQNKISANRLCTCCVKSRKEDKDSDGRDDLSSTDVIRLLEKHLINFQSVNEEEKIAGVRQEDLNQNTIDEIDNFGSNENIFRLSIKEDPNEAIIQTNFDLSTSAITDVVSTPSIEANEPIPAKSPKRT